MIYVIYIYIYISMTYDLANRNKKSENKIEQIKILEIVISAVTNSISN